MAVQLTAWAFAVVAYGIAFLCFRRSGLARGEAMLFASPFFTAPLFIAMRGAGSYIFPFDLAVPLLVLVAWRRLIEIPSSTKFVATLLFVAIGLVPLAMGAVHAPGDRLKMLYLFINAYRIAGCMALFLCATTCRVQWDRQHGFRSGLPLVAYGGLALILAVAMLLQGMGLADSNVFYRWQGARDKFDEQIMGYAVVGLFRGSLGIVGVTAVAAYLATRRTTGRLRMMVLMGAIAGVAVVVGTTSKTSLAIALGTIALAGVAAILQGQIRRVLTIMLGILLGMPVAVLVYDYMPENVQLVVSGFLSGEERTLQTLYGRQTMWVETLDYVQAHPEVAVGLGLDERAYGINIGFYHNEYLGLFMHGGVWSLAPYLIGLVLLGLLLLRNWRTQSSLTVFAVLLLAGAVLQAVTVCHMSPGIYYGSAVALLSMAYGFGLHPLTKDGEIPLSVAQSAYQSA